MQLQIQVTGHSERIDVPAKLGSLASVLRSQIPQATVGLDGKDRNDREAEEKAKVRNKITEAFEGADAELEGHRQSKDLNALWATWSRVVKRAWLDASVHLDPEQRRTVR